MLSQSIPHLQQSLLFALAFFTVHLHYIPFQVHIVYTARLHSLPRAYILDKRHVWLDITFSHAGSAVERRHSETQSGHSPIQSGDLPTQPRQPADTESASPGSTANSVKTSAAPIIDWSDVKYGHHGSGINVPSRRSDSSCYTSHDRECTTQFSDSRRLRVDQRCEPYSGRLKKSQGESAGQDVHSV